MFYISIYHGFFLVMGVQVRMQVEVGGGLGVAIAQGVELPMEAEMAWLAATMSGADGWLRIGIRLKGEV